MATNYIDVAFHGSSFPATYVVPGAIRALGQTDTSNMIAGNILANLGDTEISGTFTALGNAVVIPIGFNPTKVEVVNWTDGKRHTWMLGAPATKTLLETSTPTIGVDATSLIVVSPADGTPGSNGSITLAATLAVNAKVLGFYING